MSPPCPTIELSANRLIQKKEWVMEKAVIIKTDGTKEVVEFELGKSFEMLQEAVEGNFQVVMLKGQTFEMWVNEEGKLIGLPQNPIATAIYSESYGVTDVIMGNVIFTGGVDSEGDTLGLSDKQVEELLAYNRSISLIF